jgi:hypothetical protein
VVGGWWVVGGWRWVVRGARLIGGGAGIDLDRLDLDGRRRLVDGLLVEVGLPSHEFVEVRAAELGFVVGLLVLRADLRRLPHRLPHRRRVVVVPVR